MTGIGGSLARLDRACWTIVPRQVCSKAGRYYWVMTELSDRQRQQVDGIASLVTQPDEASIRQGVELAAALGDQTVFAALLDGVEAPPPVPKKRAPHRRYPTLVRGSMFDQPDGEKPNRGQVWLDLAMAHLLAASEHPLRHTVRSLALGGPKGRATKPNPAVWLAGLERLTSLTHLDILLSPVDEGMDLAVLQQFPRLTHLRLRGPTLPGPVPSLEHLKVLDGMRVAFGADAAFPALKTIRGRFSIDTPINPSMMPSLTNVEARGGLRLEGYERLEKLWCHHGAVQAHGCQRIGRLRVISSSLDAPDLRHVGQLVGAGPGVDVSRLETLESVQLNQTAKYVGGDFPKGTKLAHPKVVLWGPTLADLGNVGELPGLEILSMLRVKAPVSLETLRHAKSLRELDIRNSPGITDLTPLIGLPNLEVIIVRDADPVPIPAELAGKTRNSRPPAKPKKKE